MIHTTLQVSESLFDSAVTEISARNEKKFYFATTYQATRLTLSLGLQCTFEREQSVSFCFTGRDKPERLLLFFDLYFWRGGRRVVPHDAKRPAIKEYDAPLTSSLFQV